MRIAELSRLSGVPVPTIKYYLREGLLPPGNRISRNQTDYGEQHYRRLKLVRAMVDVGGVSIAAARSVLAEMTSGAGAGVLDHIGKAQYAITSPRDHVEDEAWDTASEQVRDLISRRGWLIGPDSPARSTLADVLAALYRLGHNDYPSVLDNYATATDQLAVAEVDMILRRADLDGMAEAVIILTALGDTLLAALRRLSQENRAARQLNLRAGEPAEVAESASIMEDR